MISIVQNTSQNVKIPEFCPVCSTKLITTGEYLICPNSLNCPAQIAGRIINWINTLNVLEWGKALINRLVESRKVITVADLYRLTKEDLLTIERMGDKSAEKALNILNSNKEISIEQFFGGLSISMAGESIFRMIASAGYDSINKIRKLTYQELIDIPRIGPEKSQLIINGLQQNSNLIDDLISVGIKIKEKTGSLKGLTFVFTGSMVMDRKALQKIVTDNGGVIGKSVSKTTSFLVAADHTTSKALAAQKHGVKCITEEQFLAMVK